MLKAVSKEEMVDKNGELDIYAFIRSPEIREYMRKNETFNLSDTIFLILKSMNPWETKLEALKILAHEESLSEQKKRHVLYTAGYAERILQEIYCPENPAILSVNEYYCMNEDYLNSYEVSVKGLHYTGYYSSYNEFLAQYADYLPEESLPLPRYEIDLVYPGKNCKNNNPIHFSATWFNGKIRIYAIHADSGWGEAHCFKHKITNYLAGRWMGRYSLPFPTMSKVKLQTPFMRRPLSGILESTLDDCHCWYHFFYPYDGRGLTEHFMDFSYQEIESGSDLTIFDWVSTDSGK